MIRYGKEYDSIFQMAKDQKGGYRAELPGLDVFASPEEWQEWSLIAERISLMEWTVSPIYFDSHVRS